MAGFHGLFLSWRLLQTKGKISHLCSFQEWTPFFLQNPMSKTLDIINPSFLSSFFKEKQKWWDSMNFVKKVFFLLNLTLLSWSSTNCRTCSKVHYFTFYSLCRHNTMKYLSTVKIVLFTAVVLIIFSKFSVE